MAYTRAELKMMNAEYMDEIVDAFASKMIERVLTTAQKTAKTSVRFMIQYGGSEGIDGVILVVLTPYKLLHTVHDFRGDTLYDHCKEKLQLRLENTFYDSTITVTDTRKNYFGRVLEFTIDWT